MSPLDKLWQVIWASASGTVKANSGTKQREKEPPVMLKKSRKWTILEKVDNDEANAAQQDVVELFTLSYNLEEQTYNLEEQTRQQKEREEKMRKVKVMLKGRKVKVMLKGMKMKVMLPKLECTLKGKMLVRFRQEVREILKEQSLKLDMPVL